MNNNRDRRSWHHLIALLLVAVYLSMPTTCGAQSTYQKRFIFNSVSGSNLSGIVYSAQYGANVVVVAGFDIIVFNPATGAIVSRNNISNTGAFFRINAAYKSGDVLYCTATNATTAEETGCLLRYNLSTGTFAWQQMLHTGTDGVVLNSITGDGAGSLYIAGSAYNHTYGKHDIVAIKADTSGNVAWAKTIGHDTLDETPSAICYNSNREIYIAAYAQPTAAFGTSLLLRLDSAGAVIDHNRILAQVPGPRMATTFAGIVNGRLYTVTNTYLGPSDPGPVLIRALDSSFSQLAATMNWGLLPRQAFFNDNHLLLTGQAPITFGRPGFRVMRFNAGLNLLGSRYFDKISTGSIATSASCFINDSNQSFHFFKVSSSDTFEVVKADSTEYVGCDDTAFVPNNDTLIYADTAYAIISNTLPLSLTAITLNSTDAIMTVLHKCPSIAGFVMPVEHEGSIAIYPNPASDVITISGNTEPFRNSQVNVRVLSVDGKTAQSVTGIFDNSGKLRVNISGLPAGMYFCEVANEKGVARGKVVVY